MKRICVFCGSSFGTKLAYKVAAQAVGETLAKRNIGLVYGGGNVGLMGIMADAALATGGEVIGVIPQSLVDKEIAHANLTQLYIVSSMHERKALMADLADAFIALPGGFGTLEEFCEVLTWNQLGIYQKPCGLLNIEGYYDSLTAFFDNAVSEQFLRIENRQIVLEAATIEPLLEKLFAYKPVKVEKWIDRRQR